jgi:hypothetical protein
VIKPISYGRFEDPWHFFIDGSMALLAAFLPACLGVGIPYRLCNHTNGTVKDCRTLNWTNTDDALVPCSLLPREFRICTSRGLDKFQKYFPDMPGELIGDGCDRKYDDINSFGRGVCRPAQGVVCLGEQIWIAEDSRCFSEGRVSFVTVLVCSLFFGIFGADRYLLGYALLGTIKLLTLGGFGIWQLVDIILIALGRLDPHMSRYSNSY